MHEMTRHHWTQDEKVREALKKEDSEVASLAHYVYEYGGFPAYENTGIQYFHCGRIRSKTDPPTGKGAEIYLHGIFYCGKRIRVGPCAGSAEAKGSRRCGGSFYV